MKVTIEKSKLQDIIQKSLGAKGKDTILPKVVLRFEKENVLVGELIGLTLGVVGSFKSSYFSEYKIKKAVDIVFELDLLNKIGYLREDKIKLTVTDHSLLMSTTTGKEMYPVELVTKEVIVEDMTLEKVHEEVKPIVINIGAEEKEHFVDLEPTYERSLLTSDHKYYNHEEWGYYPIYIYLRLPRSELTGLPPSDSIIFRKSTLTEKGMKAIPVVELETVTKLKIGEGYQRVLTNVEFLKWHDPSNFEVRIDRAVIDCALAHLGDKVNIVIGRDHIFLSDVQEDYWLGYLIGLIEEEAETIEPEEDDAEGDAPEVGEEDVEEE